MSRPAAVHEATELRIPDVVTFLAVCRVGSVTGAARDLSVTPSQVSKAVARLERHLRRPLLSRRPRGVVPSEDAQELVPRLEELVDKARALSSVSGVAPELRLTLAAPSSICAAFGPTVIGAVPEARVRALEVSGAFIRGYAGEDIFQMALTIGAEKLPASWVSTRAGSVRRGLFASPELALELGHAPPLAKVLEVPFVMPVYANEGALLPGADDCPVPRERRITGHEATSIGVAMELAASSHQLVFGPALAARTLMLAGRLVEVKVAGWRLVDHLWFHASSDRVLARVQKSIVSALRDAAREA